MTERRGRWVYGPAGILAGHFLFFASGLPAGRTPAPRAPACCTALERGELAVVVKGPDGRFASDLTVEDFQVLEDGDERTVITAALIDPWTLDEGAVYDDEAVKDDEEADDEANVLDSGELEDSQYYLLRYHQIGTQDDRAHSITVKVRRPGLTVSACHGPTT